MPPKFCSCVIKNILIYGMNCIFYQFIFDCERWITLPLANGFPSAELKPTIIGTLEYRPFFSDSWLNADKTAFGLGDSIFGEKNKPFRGFPRKVICKLKVNVVLILERQWFLAWQYKSRFTYKMRTWTTKHS